MEMGWRWDGDGTEMGWRRDGDEMGWNGGWIGRDGDWDGDVDGDGITMCADSNGLTYDVGPARLETPLITLRVILGTTS